MDKGRMVGAVADTETRATKALELYWAYRNIEPTGLDTLRVTNLVMDKVTISEGAKLYASCCHRRTLAAEPSKEWDQQLLWATQALNSREVRVHENSLRNLRPGTPLCQNLPVRPRY